MLEPQLGEYDLLRRSMPAGLELGGLLGGTLSGVLSDKSIRAAKSDPKAGLVGRRVQIIMAYTAVCIGVLLTLKQVPTGASSLQWIVIAALGFTIYGPQVRCSGRLVRFGSSD